MYCPQCNRILSGTNCLQCGMTPKEMVAWNKGFNQCLSFVQFNLPMKRKED